MKTKPISCLHCGSFSVVPSVPIPMDATDDEEVEYCCDDCGEYFTDSPPAGMDEAGVLLKKVPLHDERSGR